MNFITRSRRQSLAFQFLSILSGIMLVGFVSIIYTQFQNQSKQINENISARAESIGGLLAQISVQPLLVHDFVTLNEYIEDAAMQKDVTYVIVSNPQGETLVIQANEKTPSPEEVVDDKVDSAGNEGENIFRYEQSIMFDGRQLGQVRIGVDRAPAAKLVASNVTNLAVTIFGIWFFSGLAIFLAFRYKVSRPINLVSSSAAEIANLKFGRTVPVTGNNEISQLALTFNGMRMQLKVAVEERQKSLLELEDLNASLEERVNQRTQELQTLNREVAYQAVHDPLTGLPNRLLITERIQYAIKQSHRSKETFAVLMVDLDNFKEVNDTLGHPVGDALLRQVSLRLSSVLRDSDTVGRLGGDEFALQLQGADEEAAMLVAEKIQTALLETYIVDGHALVASGSIGIALYPEHGDDHAMLLRCADIAMYAAKRNNSKVSLYSVESDKHSLQRLELTNDLRVALDAHELELYYQPVMALATGEVVGVEALLRWQHPKYGEISPNEFIPIAENTALIKPLTDWVMKTAALQWLEWQEQGLSLHIAVNLSMINLLDHELPDRISSLRRDLKLPPDAIKFEITESAIMSNPERVISVMSHEDMAGLKFSVDDFGTGYSSLSYLKRLPVSEVKIDRSFVTMMTVDDEDASIVRAVIDLAHNLGLMVVAEGVEDEAVLKQLVSLGCDYAQGFYFAVPLPADKFIEAISKIKSLPLGQASQGSGGTRPLTH